MQRSIRNMILATSLLAAPGGACESAQADLVIGYPVFSSWEENNWVSAPSSSCLTQVVHFDAEFEARSLQSIVLPLKASAPGVIARVWISGIPYGSCCGALPASPSEWISLGVAEIAQGGFENYVFFLNDEYVLEPSMTQVIVLTAESGPGTLYWAIASWTPTPGSDPHASMGMAGGGNYSFEGDWVMIYDGGIIFPMSFELHAAPPARILGDLNGDDLVDGADLGLFLGAWGACPRGESCPADLNLDGIVDGADLGVLLANWS